MRMNKVLSITSMGIAMVFALLIILTSFGIGMYHLIGPFEWFFGVPLYITLFITYTISIVFWLKERDRQSFLYLLYNTIAWTITIGSLLVVTIRFARVMEDF